MSRVERKSLDVPQKAKVNLARQYIHVKSPETKLYWTFRPQIHSSVERGNRAQGADTPGKAGKRLLQRESDRGEPLLCWERIEWVGAGRPGRERSLSCEVRHPRSRFIVTLAVRLFIAQIIDEEAAGTVASA